MASEKQDTALLNAVSTVLMAFGAMVLPEEKTAADWWEQRCAEEPGCAECKCFDL